MYKALKLAVIALMFAVATALAEPSLQIDIAGGTYDGSTETIVTSDTSFSLFALGSIRKGVAAGDTYYMSFAVVGDSVPGEDDGGSIGSFTVNGDVYDVTDDLVWGVPPVEVLGGDQGHDGGDLPKHGIYPTWFKQLAFEFDTGNQTAVYNSEDDPGTDPTTTPGSGLLFEEFLVTDIDLPGGMGLHFDLYNTSVDGTDVDRGDFAPFSHDGEWLPGSDEGPNVIPEPVTAIPEPVTATLSLLVLGSVGIMATRRRREA